MRVGLDGGVESRLIVSGTLVVPAELVALHVSVVVPAGGLAAAQPVELVTGEPVSEALQVTCTGLRYHPFAPSGLAGEIVAVTSGGVGSAIATARSASRSPTPHWRPGVPGVVHARALAGFFMIA